MKLECSESEAIASATRVAASWLRRGWNGHALRARVRID